MSLSSRQIRNVEKNIERAIKTGNCPMKIVTEILEYRKNAEDTKLSKGLTKYGSQYSDVISMQEAIACLGFSKLLIPYLLALLTCVFLASGEVVGIPIYGKAIAICLTVAVYITVIKTTITCILMICHTSIIIPIIRNFTVDADTLALLLANREISCYDLF